MNLFLYILVSIVQTVIFVEWLLMFIRAILSWIMPDAEGGILDVLFYLTEPLIQPIRNLLYKIPALQEFPIDLSFMVTTLLLGMIAMFI